jgi:glycosyltransferase involved in cell wall biosynthesis
MQLKRVFCRHSLRVPWYPQPDVSRLILGHRVPTPFGIYLFLVSLFALWRYRPDVAYMNTGFDGFEPAIAAARLTGTKVLCHLRMSRMLSPHEVRLASRVEQLVTSSQWAAKAYQQQVGDRTGTTCVYEAIDVADFDARANENGAAPLPKGPLYFCQVGTLVERKRPRLAIEAFDLARTQVPNMKLVLVGGGPQHKELQALIRARGLDEHVLLLDHRPDIPKLLRSAHIGLLLSEDEGLPNVVMEYMASGLPIIVTRLPFIDELVQHGHNGLVVDEPNAPVVAEAMATLARSSELRAHMGRAGRERLDAGPFHAEREARETEALITRVTKAATGHAAR